MKKQCQNKLDEGCKIPKGFVQYKDVSRSADLVFKPDKLQKATQDKPVS